MNKFVHKIDYPYMGLNNKNSAKTLIVLLALFAIKWLKKHLTNIQWQWKSKHRKERDKLDISECFQRSKLQQHKLIDRLIHYSYHETHYKHLNGTGMKKKEKKNELLK